MFWGNKGKTKASVATRDTIRAREKKNGECTAEPYAYSS